MYTRGTGRRSGARKPVNILLLIPSKKMWPLRPHLLVLSQQFSFTLGQPEVCAGVTGNLIARKYYRGVHIS